MRVLWVTNDLPPRAGGIEQFVANLLGRVHPTTTVVVGPRHDEAAPWDDAQPFTVVRVASRTLLPTPGLLHAVRDVAADHRPEVIVLGASWPLGELAPALRRRPGCPVVALTHGLEAGLARVGLGRLVRRATRALAAVTTISDFTARSLAGHLEAARVRRLPPGVDTTMFHPATDGTGLRTRWQIPVDVPLVGCISRLVRRKGQDVLLSAWERVRAAHPDAWLVIAGDGPDAARIRARAEGLARVRVGGPLSWEDIPAAHAALDVFAMPCRTRWFGLDVEGLGIVYLEAQSSGVPVVAGGSGGAPEAVRHGDTGLVTDGRDPVAVAGSLAWLLDDPDRRTAMGLRAREWVEARWSWDAVAARFADLLDEVSA